MLMCQGTQQGNTQPVVYHEKDVPGHMQAICHAAALTWMQSMIQLCRLDFLRVCAGSSNAGAGRQTSHAFPQYCAWWCSLVAQLITN